MVGRWVVGMWGVVSGGGWGIKDLSFRCRPSFAVAQPRLVGPCVFTHSHTHSFSIHLEQLMINVHKSWTPFSMDEHPVVEM